MWMTSSLLFSQENERKDKMANVILDTNVYGKIIEDKDSEKLIEVIIKNDKFIIHNFRIIRDELRKAPKLALEV